MLDVGCSPKKSSQKGSVLIIVLWIVIGLVGITLYFANAMTLEYRASDNRMNGLAADQAIEGAARYVGYALVNYATNGMMPTNALFTCTAVPIGDSHFWIIGRDPSTTAATEPAFGLIDEASKLNLNRANTNILSYLPNMTSDLAGAIVDWRSTNGSGTYSLNYGTLGYQDKNAPFESVEELRLVYGMTIDLLVGGDINRNGVLDGNEKSSAGGTAQNTGLLDYTTVYSREPNVLSDGTSLTNVNNFNSVTEMQSFFQNAGASSDETMLTAVYNSIKGDQRARPPVTGVPCRSVLDFYLRCMSNGLSADDFAKIYNNITTTTNTYTSGRVNVNTAGEDVLTALIMGANIDQSTAEGAAQSLIAYRGSNPDSLTSPAWIVTALGQSSTVPAALAAHDWITTKSFQFTADIAAVGPLGRGYRRVKFVFDITDGTPKIIYRQDLSRLGWALGEKVRQTFVANNTP
jgi:type II secretory pathway component PulK